MNNDDIWYRRVEYRCHSFEQNVELKWAMRLQYSNIRELRLIFANCSVVSDRRLVEIMVKTTSNIAQILYGCPEFMEPGLYPDIWLGKFRPVCSLVDKAD